MLKKKVLKESNFTIIRYFWKVSVATNDLGMTISHDQNHDHNQNLTRTWPWSMNNEHALDPSTPRDDKKEN